MIDRKALTDDLKRLLPRLEADLLERSESPDVPDVGAALRAEYASARKAERTAQSFEEWRTDQITQMAAAWALSAVFARFLEDNQLVDPPRIAGPGERLRRAHDEHELYFRAHPIENDRDYLLHVFRELATLPGAREIFGPHNALWFLPQWLSGDAGIELLAFFRKIAPNTGALLHDFTDPEWNTRFLGDLYQDLSESARKKYALLQTPDFVEAFILDRTLEPALDEFGLRPGKMNINVQDTQDSGKEPKSCSSCPSMLNEGVFRFIDPACGSGHFLLGAFARILDRWQRKEPATPIRELVRRTLSSIHGVDVNPFAAAIARFRLLIAALKACGVRRLKDAPAFELRIEAGDSLLHGVAGLDKATGQGSLQLQLGFYEYGHYYRTEDPEELRHILVPGAYHAVVANPPYITVKDKAQNQAYRERYGSCSGKYSLSVPFMERIFNLAVRGERGGGGYTGQITSNSFMKREFGKKLIEEFIPRWDLTHVIDTSHAFIPDHGTATVILFGRNRKPIGETVRTVLGIRAQQPAPEDPAKGLVWSSILELVDQPGTQSAYVSAGDTERLKFHAHPWSVGGGGAAELKEEIADSAQETLGKIATDIGITSVTGLDDLYAFDRIADLARHQPELVKPLVIGDQLRDYEQVGCLSSIWTYDERMKVIDLAQIPCAERLLWLGRATLKTRRRFGTPMAEKGLTWYEWQELYADKLRTPLSLTFSFVATHNHFVLDRGGKVFKQTAPVIKLPAGATEADHLPLLGLLNSSTACFWMKQVFHDKGSGGIGGGISVENWEHRFEFDGTKLKQFPIPATKPLALPRELDRLAQALKEQSPEAALARWQAHGGSLNRHLADAEREADTLRGRMIALQEELDWECYRHYGLMEESLIYTDGQDGQDRGGTKESDINAQDDRKDSSSCLSCPSMFNTPSMSISLGQRAFEIVLARQVAAGDEETTWFERHKDAGSRPITEIPSHWPPAYRALVERRIAKIATDRNIALIEKPEYKRRWNTQPWAERQSEALRAWLLGRLESFFDFDGRMNDAKTPTATFERGLVSVARLADVAANDAQFMEVGELYRNDRGFDLPALVEELVESESVPFLPVLRYKATGLRKRAEWERTWELQRLEDAIDARTKLPVGDPARLDAAGVKKIKAAEVGDIAVPPKYTSADFASAVYWRLRGKLDVPKERWVTFPHCEGPDGTLVVAWAGYDHLQLARAIAEYFVCVQERIGGRDDARLIPLLGALIELIPWLKQWHNEVDSEYGYRMGDYYEGFVQEEARKMEKTLDDVQKWEPPARTIRRGRGRKKG
jgi:hypothetical protein